MSELRAIILPEWWDGHNPVAVYDAEHLTEIKGGREVVLREVVEVFGALDVSVVPSVPHYVIVEGDDE